MSRYQWRGDETLADLLPHIGKPIDFVVDAREVMRQAEKQHGQLLLRVGITGTKRAPNYRLDRLDTSEPVLAFNGANHAPWLDHENFAAPENWSVKGMTFDDLTALQAQVRPVGAKLGARKP